MFVVGKMIIIENLLKTFRYVKEIFGFSGLWTTTKDFFFVSNEASSGLISSKYTRKKVKNYPFQ